jgi:hypothetical protein
VNENSHTLSAKGIRISTLGASEGTLITAETMAIWWPVSSRIAVDIRRETITWLAGGIDVDVEDETFDVLADVELVRELTAGVLIDTTGQLSSRCLNEPGFEHSKVAISF